MPYISAVPAVRTPFGVDVFDYKIDDGAPASIGDLVRVPFRRRSIPALVVSISDSSLFAAKAVSVAPIPLLHLGPIAARLLEATAKRTFCSQPTVLASWIRHVPARAIPVASPVVPGTVERSAFTSDRTNRSLGASDSLGMARNAILTTSRLPCVLDLAGGHEQGRLLILTPWKQRADLLARKLEAPVFHADLADGAAWSAVRTFSEQKNGILIATRIGAWLSALSDAVIVDEPENDDFKQDELSPRFDARWMLTETARIKPLGITSVGTTPLLGSPDPAPDIDLPLTLEAWQKGARTTLPGVSANAINHLEQALEEKRSVVILHPIRGNRSRISCRDCRWQLECASCGFPLTDEGALARCHRCGRTQDIPHACPSCGGMDLGAARIGKEKLAEIATQQYGGRVRVADLPDWHKLALPPKSLVILTDFSLIGGFAEDIRRRERLIISWRRLAASVAQAEGSLYVLGPESSLSEARSWLSRDGLRAAWTKEQADRANFQYPPVRPRIKVLLDGTEDTVASRLEQIRTDLPEWEVEGPYQVQFRAKTRKPRCVAHFLPPKTLDNETIFRALEPYAKTAIIDLDPIAFFS